MFIAYLTLDEVNQDLAPRLAEACRATVHAWTPREALPAGAVDAVLIDLDSLPPQERQSILSGLLTRTAPYPVAVHSYNLEEGQVEALHHKGVAVHRRLTPALLRHLGRRVRQGRAAVFASGSEESGNHAA